MAKREEMICEWITSDDETLEGARKLFPLVRCKDCRYFHENVFGDEIGLGKPYDCLIVGHCCCEFWGRKDDGSMTQTSPEGFCSFGERRSE